MVLVALVERIFSLIETCPSATCDEDSQAEVACFRGEGSTKVLSHLDQFPLVTSMDGARTLEEECESASVQGELPVELFCEGYTYDGTKIS